jgi:hypothetical protein
LGDFGLLLHVMFMHPQRLGLIFMEAQHVLCQHFGDIPWQRLRGQKALLLLG